MNEIDKLAWLCVKDNHVLCARSRGKDTYYIPGGKREPGESDHEALIREIKEELSIDLHPETIAYAGTFTAQAHGKPDSVFVKITAYFAEFTGAIQENAEIEEVRWVSDKTSVLCSPVTEIIIDWLKTKEMPK
ncbi:MAG: NUDIX domain-containing protein [Legionella sp.]|nr:NUDIX domain-containing protein [Legionella sp.]